MQSISDVVAILDAVDSMTTVLQDSMETGHLDSGLYAPHLAVISEKVEEAISALRAIEATL